MNEIEEFYSYVEMPQVAENLKAWEGSFSGSMSLPPALLYVTDRNPRMDRQPAGDA
jgi:hypothetical protein